jgi:hypothetical protein
MGRHGPTRGQAEQAEKRAEQGSDRAGMRALRASGARRCTGHRRNRKLVIRNWCGRQLWTLLARTAAFCAAGHSLLSRRCGLGDVPLASGSE